MGDGFATSGKDLTGFQHSGGATQINWRTGVFLDETDILSGGGDIYMAGQHNVNNGVPSAGFINYSGGSGTVIDASSGTVTLIGESHEATNGNFGMMTGLHPQESIGIFTVKSSNNSSPTAINIEGKITTNTGDGILIEDQTRILSTAGTNGGGIQIVGSSANRNAISVGINTNPGTLEVLSASGDIVVDVGSDSLLVATNGAFKLGSISGDADVAASTADVTIISDDADWPGNVPVRTTGTLTVKPSAGNSFSVPFNSSGLTYEGITGLTIGHADNTGAVTIGSATNIAGPIQIYGGNIAVDNQLSATGGTLGTNTVLIQASGNVTDGASGYITGEKLTLKGAGSFALDNASNDVDTLYVGNDNAAAVSSLAYKDADDLMLDAVNVAGINSTGAVNVGTLLGDLTLAADITTANTSSNAIVLNAGTNFYRYNADETTDFSSGSWLNLTNPGTYVIYREQPKLEVSATGDAKTYDGLAYSGGNGYGVSPAGLVNGDADALVVDSPVYGGSSQGATNVGSYAITMSGLVSQLGYGFNYTDAGLTINAKDKISLPTIWPITKCTTAPRRLTCRVLW